MHIISVFICPIMTIAMFKTVTFLAFLSIVYLADAFSIGHHEISRESAFNAEGECPPRDTNETIFLTDSENCTIYYICSNGNPIQLVCPPDMAFNPVSHICDWEIDVQCKAGLKARQSQLKTAVGTCPEKDPEFPVFLPDSERCDIYYECSGGEPIQNECSPGLEFNPTLNVCDFPLDAGCKANSSTKARMTLAVYSSVGTCPDKDPAFPVFLPDSERCDIYYECSDGEPIQNECSPGLEFNPTLNVCDFPLDAGCKANSRSNTRIKSAIYSADGTCPDKDPAFPVFLPDSERCDIYYECSGGEPIQNECSPGLEFNPTLNVCDFPLDAGCKASVGNDSTILRSTFSAIGSCPPRDTNDTIFLPDDKNCTIYYLCSNGNPILNICPPGQSWNTNIETCDWDINVDCSRRLRSAPRSVVGSCPPRDPSTPVYLPDSDDCSIYYQCSNGNAIQNVCPPEMYWNAVLNVCDWAVDVACANGTKISF